MNEPPAAGSPSEAGHGVVGGPDSGTAHVGYAEAVLELEGILARLEHDDVDVDALAAEVRRAAELIAICRDRIHLARTEVERVVRQLTEPGE